MAGAARTGLTAAGPLTFGQTSAGMGAGAGMKGGASGVRPTVAMPTAGQRPMQMPMSAAGSLGPQGLFNVQSAAAGGLQRAMQGTMAGMQYQPERVGAASYRPAQIAGQDLGAYTNPYESQVVGQALGDIERSRQMQQNQLGAQATAARAFGGSRQGIAEAETNRAFAEQAAKTAAGLRQAGYGQAQQFAGQDVAAQNQAAQLAAAAQNAAMAANQAAGLQGAQQRLGAASQMGQLGQQAFNTGQAITAQQMQQGMLQQQLQQQLIDAAKGQYAGYTGAPTSALNLPLAALGQANMGQGTTTQTQQPSLFQFLSPFLI